MTDRSNTTIVRITNEPGMREAVSAARVSPHLATRRVGAAQPMWPGAEPGGARGDVGMCPSEFEQALWHLRPQLLRHATLQLNEMDAEDVVSETMATMWRKRLPSPTSLEDELGLRSLAYRVLTGHIQNAVRAHARRRALGERVTMYCMISDLSSAHTDNPLHAEGSVRDWLLQLSEADREVLRLDMAGFDAREVGQVLRCSTEAAAKRRSRARGRLREVVERDRGVDR